jgi:hypothetical protein
LRLLFNFALEYGIMKVHEDQKVRKCNGTNQIVVYADVNLSAEKLNMVSSGKSASKKENQPVRHTQ